MKEISIVIVTWNCKKYAEECLDSLRPYIEDPQAEVIVVDNASWDGTPQLIRESYPGVNLIESKENLGFARGNNVGLRHATGKYICLINPDVRVGDVCIAKMHAYMEANPRVGLLGPRMLAADGKPYRSYMGEPTLWRMFCRAVALDDLFPRSALFGGFMMHYFDLNQVAEVDVLNGWFWMTRRDAFDQVGNLDETLFMYGDDLDWSKRFHAAGWKVVYYSEAESLHYGGATTARAPVPFSIEMQRANFQYWKKNHDGRVSQILYLMVIWIHQAVRIVGYSLLLAARSKRSQAAFKVKRSFECMMWVIGLRNQRGAELR